MNRTQYIFLTALLLLLTGCGKHSAIPDKDTNNVPIEFGISSDLSVESKTVIDKSNCTSHGFMVQAGLTVDSWKTNAVFETGTEVTYGTGGWGYSPARYWQTGSYVFAGAMPSSADFSISLDEATHKTLTLDFGDGGYDLRAGQDDIMVGFKTVDVQSTASTSQVDFTFAHQLALVTIDGANTESRGKIRIDEIKIYGNSSKVSGNLVFTYDADGYTITPAYTLTGTTTERDVYMAITYPNQTWMLASTNGTPNYITLVPEILVFPEKCSFSIVVTYTDYYGDDEGVQVTKTGTLAADWERGMRYTYRFAVTLDDITFAEPTVEPWDETGTFDSDIQM